MNFSRITIFTGHYGSGKTNLAINTALYIKSKGLSASICDIDIVNPYFRTADSAKILGEAGIRLITSKFTNSNADLPSIPAEANSLFNDKDTHAIFDVGGDDRGAMALGRYETLIKQERTAAMLLVINKYRPLTSYVSDTIEIMREIERASHVKFTGIVNNSNLGKETKPGHILSSLSYAGVLSELTGLPIVMTSVREDLLSEVEKHVPNPFPIRIMEKDIWKI